jgi:GNAT superfamily N-acetyltransferase
MEIVRANASDLTEIVQLLKESLGEKLMPKSAAFFSWKHFQNPFGESVILLAKEEGRIVGVRAFMNWQWATDREICRAVRAVDTATHPDFQGKGIFSKLTMKAVETCKENHTGFVFNSPNKISIKGYLKLGWYSNGKMPLTVKPIFTLPFKSKKKSIEELYDEYSISKALASLEESWKIKEVGDNFITPVSKAYLVWRYRDCPVAQYGAVIQPGLFGIIFRIKKHRKLLECRLTEVWLEDENAKKALQNALNEMIRKTGVSFVTCAPLADAKGKLHLSGFWGPFGIGPEITLKTLAMDNLYNFNGYFRWSPSIGSMELF